MKTVAPITPRSAGRRCSHRSVDCGSNVLHVVEIVVGCRAECARHQSHEAQDCALLGYEMTAAELSSAVEMQRQMLSSLTYDPQQQSARAGAALQQTLRGTAEDADATVTGVTIGQRAGFW